MDAFVLDLILSHCARTKLRTESEGDWEVIVSSWLLFGNRVSLMHTEICHSGIEQWLTHTLEMQTAVLHHQNGINIIKLLKIAKLMRILMRKMKKKIKKFCMGLRKKQPSMNTKNNYGYEVVYTKFCFSIFQQWSDYPYSIKRDILVSSHWKPS